MNQLPKLGTKLNTEFIKGMGKREEVFIILLDIDKVFSYEELAMVQATDLPEKASDSQASLEL